MNHISFEKSGWESFGHIRLWISESWKTNTINYTNDHMVLLMDGSNSLRNFKLKQKKFGSLRFKFYYD